MVKGKPMPRAKAQAPLASKAKPGPNITYQVRTVPRIGKPHEQEKDVRDLSSLTEREPTFMCDRHLRTTSSQHMLPRCIRRVA